MKNVLLKITIQTTRPMGERDVVRAILERISAVPGLTPKRFGSWEPLNRRWGAGFLEDLASLYQGRGEMCSFRLDPKMHGGFTLVTQRNPMAICHEIDLSVDFGRIQGRLADVVELLRDLALMVDADFAAMSIGGGDPFWTDVQDMEKNVGEMGGVRIPRINPTGIRFLNGIWWINVFGQHYLDFFGKQTFENLPAYRGEFIGPGHFWLQPTRTPEEMWGESGIALREVIKIQLGRPKAFYGYEKGKPGMMLTYETPSFDFSRIQQKI